MHSMSKKLENGEIEICTTCANYFCFIYKKAPEKKEMLLKALRKIAKRNP